MKLPERPLRQGQFLRRQIRRGCFSPVHHSILPHLSRLINQGKLGLSIDYVDSTRAFTKCLKSSDIGYVGSGIQLLEHCFKAVARHELHRRNYGLEMGVVFAAFGYLPALAKADGETERAEWINVCRQMLGAFCRTLPPSGSDTEAWKYEPWSFDKKVFSVVARRLFECSKEERVALWSPILDLVPAAHHYITEFLNAVLLEALRTEPPRMTELASIWCEMAEHLDASEKWSSGRTRDTGEVWKTILLYGTPFTSTSEQMFGPLVEALRPVFERHAIRIVRDAHEQSSVARFLTTKARERLLVDALVWLKGSWDSASSYFWKTAVERGLFERLLEHAWREHLAAVRKNPTAFSAFKVLTMNLAAHHIPIALEIQQQIGTNFE